MSAVLTCPSWIAAEFTEFGAATTAAARAAAPRTPGITYFHCMSSTLVQPGHVPGQCGGPESNRPCRPSPLLVPAEFRETAATEYGDDSADDPVRDIWVRRRDEIHAVQLIPDPHQPVRRDPETEHERATEQPPQT